MNSVSERLKLISRFDQYAVHKEDNSYYVSDYDNDLEAIYNERYDNWDYGVIGIIGSDSDFKSVDVKALNKLVEITRKLSESE